MKIRTVVLGFIISWFRVDRSRIPKISLWKWRYVPWCCLIWDARAFLDVLAKYPGIFGLIPSWRPLTPFSQLCSKWRVVVDIGWSGDAGDGLGWIWAGSWFLVFAGPWRRCKFHGNELDKRPFWSKQQHNHRRRFQHWREPRMDTTDGNSGSSYQSKVAHKNRPQRVCLTQTAQRETWMKGFQRSQEEPRKKKNRESNQTMTQGLQGLLNKNNVLTQKDSLSNFGKEAPVRGWKDKHIWSDQLCNWKWPFESGLSRFTLPCASGLSQTTSKKRSFLKYEFNQK